MRMKLVSLALALAFCSSAAAVGCKLCSDFTDPTCANAASVDCPTTDTMCIAATIQITSSGTTTQRIIKSCADSTFCPAVGSQTFSLTTGASTTVLAQATCCNNNNCNKDAPTPLATPTLGLLQCYNCNPLTGPCTTSIQCNSLETSCFQTTEKTLSGSVPVHGCTSANTCASSATSALTTLLLQAAYGTVTEPTSCCTTNNCNVLITTAPPATTITTAAPTTTSTTTAAAHSAAYFPPLDFLHLVLGLLVFALF